MLLVLPPDRFCLCTEHITVVLILNGHCYYFKRFQRDYLLPHCCTVCNSRTGSLLVRSPCHGTLIRTLCSTPPAEPCLLLHWHQASCQAIPATHQDSGMVSTAACKFWLSNSLVFGTVQAPDNSSWLQLELPLPCAATATTVTSHCHPATLPGSSNCSPIMGFACHSSEEVKASGGRVPSDSTSPFSHSTGPSHPWC